MTRLTLSLGAALGLTLLASQSVQAGDLNEDSQVWTSVQVSKALSKRFSYSGTFIYRRAQDWSTSSLYASVPVMISYKLTDAISMSVGYAYLYIPGTRDLHENRGLTQLSINHGRWMGGNWDSTLTVEDRTVRESSKDAWRARWRLRYRTPFTGWQVNDKPVGLAAWIEPRTYLSDTDWGPKEGYDATRMYVGLEFALGKKTRLDVGYINHYAPRSGADTMNHALSAALQLNL